MANETRGGKRLAKNKPAQPVQPAANDFTFNYHTPAPSSNSTDDAVIDEILRSISGNDPVMPGSAGNPAPEQSAAPFFNIPQPQPQQPQPQQPQPQQQAQSQATMQFRPQPAQMNEYQAAADHMAQQQQQQQQTTGAPTDPYGMRDPAQTQSFRAARPAQRNTDRLPTLVDDAPKKRHPVLERLVTLLVVVLILAALVLGARMVYILGPSLGWNLPDLSNVPVISKVLGLIPDADEQPIALPEETAQGVTPVDETHPDPTSVTLDADDLVLHEGEKKVLTATLDVENWDGLLAWASSDRDEKVIRLTVLGPNTAQVEYVGEGNCAVAVQVGVKPEDGSPAPHATCAITCEAAAPAEEPAEQEQPQEGGAETEQPSGEHVDIALNRDDFTLKAGERHSLMGDNADKVTWSSSKESVATVSNGVVTAVAPGTATITATGPDGTTATAICRVK